MATTMPHISDKLQISKSFIANQSIFNVFTGTNTGFLKGYSTCNNISVNLNSLDSVSSKANEITCMCWWDTHDEQYLLTGLRDGRVQSYCLEDGFIFNVPVAVPEEKSIMRSVKAYEKTVLISAFNTGKVNCEHFTFTSEPTSLKQLSPSVQINAGQDLFCMDHNLSFQNQIATGGKENPLKIWDITSPSKPIFTAKNVANDWLNLRVPVWVMKAQFMHQSDKIITSTGFSQVRLYDPGAQRRPVIELQLKDSKEPITAMALKPNSDHQLLVGTTTGTLSLLDLRKKDLVQNYKGFAGGITDIKYHFSKPFFAACGVDRYVRCYETDASQKNVYSMYMQSQLNCLLLLSNSPLEDDGNNIKNNSIKKKCKESDSYLTDLSTEETEAIDKDNDERVWNQMEVIQTKKRKKQTTSHSNVKKRAN